MEGEALLTDEERGQFMEFESMFGSPGWSRLMREYENELRDLPLQAFENARSFEEIVQARIRLAVLAELALYPEIIEARKRNIIEMREQERDEAQEAQQALA